MVITVLLGCLYAAGRMEVSEVGSDAVWIRRRRSPISARVGAQRQPGNANNKALNPERVRRAANTFEGLSIVLCDPRVVAALQPWAEISERLRRISNCITISEVNFLDT
jgi:hypothetical protein